MDNGNISNFVRYFLSYLDDVDNVELQIDSFENNLVNYRLVAEMKERCESLIESLVPVLYHPRLKTNRCTICLENWKKDDEIVQIPSCEHFYHHDCIATWIREEERPSCPLCRQEIEN